MRKSGDTIMFRVMPWLWPDGIIYKGVITAVLHDENYGDYYHVDAQMSVDTVKDGIVLEKEIVVDE